MDNIPRLLRHAYGGCIRIQNASWIRREHWRTILAPILHPALIAMRATPMLFPSTMVSNAPFDPCRGRERWRAAEGLHRSGAVRSVPKHAIRRQSTGEASLDRECLH